MTESLIDPSAGGVHYYRYTPGKFIPEEWLRLKELSTCDKCKQAHNVYTLIPALSMWVCDKCRSKFNKWGLSILKRLLGYVAGVSA